MSHKIKMRYPSTTPVNARTRARPAVALRSAGWFSFGWLNKDIAIFAMSARVQESVQEQ